MKKLRIVVDRDLCDSHGICVSNAPDVFDIGDDDQLHILVPYPSLTQMPGVEAAVSKCPKGALSLLDGD